MLTHRQTVVNQLSYRLKWHWCREGFKACQLLTLETTVLHYCQPLKAAV